MRNKNLFNLFSLSYLYLPIIIFSLTWLNLFFGIIMTALIGFTIWDSVGNTDTFKIKWKKEWPYLLIGLCCILVWALLSGLGGFFQQSYDWQKHNVLINDFINKSWPVQYHFHGKNGVVSYYIGEYILPGIVGKIAGFNSAQLFLLIWIVIGLSLLVLSIYKWIGKRNGVILLLTIFSLIMFSPFIYPLSGIYSTWGQMDYSPMTTMGEWFSHSFIAQYTSNISLLRFVFPQFVPIALVVSIWIRRQRNYRLWGILAASTILYSTFAFFGLVALMGLTLLFDLYRGKVKWRDIFCRENILSFGVIVILLMYIVCNILQPKPANEQMQFTFVNIWQHKLAFLTLQGSWILWVLLLLKSEKKNPLLYFSSFILFILPFCHFGAANDLVMRVSIPSLLIINLMVIKNIVNNWNVDRYFSYLLIGALLVAGAGPLWQLKDAAKYHNFHYHIYNMPYKTGNQFFKSDHNVVYQYVDWDQGGLRKIILKNK